jgi:hypothetical protein
MDDFTRAYFEAALFSTNDESTPEGGEPLDKNYGVEDFAPETRDKMIADAADFQDRAEGMLLLDDSPQIEKWGRDALAGHDFWLTRNGHGAGFWDGDWPEQGDALTKLSKEYGEFYLYVGDDGLIYGPPPGAYDVRERGRRSPRRRVAATARQRWTVEPGRQLYFNGQPIIGLTREGGAPPVVADGAAHVIADLFNREGVTPDSIYEQHMGHAPRRR